MKFSATLLPLGTCAANRTPFQKYTAHLINMELTETSPNAIRSKAQILLDCGNSRVLDQQYLSISDLELILISHSHLDHTFYIAKLIRLIRRKFQKKSDMAHPITLIIHQKAWKKIEIRIRMKNHGKIPSFLNVKLIDTPTFSRDKERSNIDDTLVISEESYQLRNGLPVFIRCTPTIHIDNTLVYRILIGGPSERLDLVYSPDTKYQGHHLAQFARDAQYWMLDTTFTKEFIDSEYQKSLHSRFVPDPGHSSPYYSAVLCQEANVETYIVTHYFWERFGETYENAIENIKKRAQDHFQGRIFVMRDLKTFQLH